MSSIGRLMGEVQADAEERLDQLRIRKILRTAPPSSSSAASSSQFSQSKSHDEFAGVFPPEPPFQSAPVGYASTLTPQASSDPSLSTASPAQRRNGFSFVDTYLQVHIMHYSVRGAFWATFFI